jgi:2-polyprenyl-3-methyl-5-hydroxy-6-metoxy-1,4-benzoquinol methylase
MNKLLKNLNYHSSVFEEKEWKSLEDYLLFLRLKKAYQYAIKYCQNKNVLDYGCGSGYGSALLSNYAAKVIGVDIQEDIIDFCNRTYSSPNLSFQIKTMDYNLPFEDNTFDVIVSFQVIEHIPNVKRYLLELKRVLNDTGILLITTPNRKYRLLAFQRPVNPEHIREYSLRSLDKALTLVFTNVTYSGIYGNEDIHEIEQKRVKQTPFRAYVYQPCVRLLRIVLPSPFISILESFKRKTFSRSSSFNSLPINHDLLNKYSLDDFTVGPDIENCLDFLAIFYKNQKTI